MKEALVQSNDSMTMSSEAMARRPIGVLHVRVCSSGMHVSAQMDMPFGKTQVLRASNLAGVNCWLPSKPVAERQNL